MYNYDFKKDDESILKEIMNVNIKINKKYYQTNFVLTEKNLLIFHDINCGNPIWGSGTHPLPELYLLFCIPLNDLKYEIINDDLYLLQNNQKVNCYDFNLKEFLIYFQ